MKSAGFSTDPKHIADLAKQTFGTDKITKDQLSYVLDQIKPSTYLLKHHTVRGHPITFVVSGRDQEKVLAHRP